MAILSASRWCCTALTNTARRGTRRISRRKMSRWKRQWRRPRPRRKPKPPHEETFHLQPATPDIERRSERLTMEIPYTIELRPDTGVYNAKLGIWLFLASEVMLFGGLFSAYVLLRVGAVPGEWPHGWLNVTLGTINTLVLALSAITT